MKKLILCLTLGIFLITLVSADIYIIPPPDPIDFNITLEVGGSLEEGTNYTIALSGKSATSYTADAYNIYRTPINVKVITTNSTHKSINITWEYIGIHGRYLVISYRENSSDPETLMFQASSHYTQDAALVTTGLFDNTANYPTGDKHLAGYILQHYDIAQDPFPINKSLGTGLIIINGTVPSGFGAEEIKQAVDDANLSDHFLFDGTTIHTLFHLYIVADAAGQNVDLKYINYYPYGVGIHGYASDVYIDFTMANIILAGYGWRFNSQYTILTDVTVKAGAYGGVEYEAIITSSNVYMYAQPTGWYTNMKILYFEIQAFAGTILDGIKSTSNMRINSIDLTGANPTKFLNCKGAQFMDLANVNHTGRGFDVYEIRDFEAIGLGSNLWSYYSTQGEISVYDFVSAYSQLYYGDNDHVLARYRVGFSDNNSWHLHHQIAIRPVDENGNPLENATITIKDKDGNTLFSNLTNSSGYIKEDIKTMIITWNETAGGQYDNIYSTLNPLTIEISKENYEDYSVTENVTEKTDWTIALESRDWNYSKSLAWKILNSTGTTILKLSDLGNLAIAGELYENTNTAPNNVIYKIKDLFWLTRTGDLYLVKELMEVIL